MPLSRPALAPGPVESVDWPSHSDDWVIFGFLPDAVREYPGIYQHLGIG
jgi:hypothetical protein